MSDTHPTMERVFKRTGLDPSALALKINASPQNVTNWSKRGISKKGALAVAKEFGFSVDWILTGAEEQMIDRYMKVVGYQTDDGSYTKFEPPIWKHITPILDWDVTGEWDAELVKNYAARQIGRAHV